MYYDGVTCKSKVGCSVPKSEKHDSGVFLKYLQVPEIAVIYRKGRGFTALS